MRVVIIKKSAFMRATLLKRGFWLEEIRYIHDHPHAIDLIRCEDQADALRAA